MRKFRKTNVILSEIKESWYNKILRCNYYGEVKLLFQAQCRTGGAVMNCTD